MAQDDPLAQAVRDALNHLYDPDILTHSPLVEWLALGDDPAPAQALRAVLEKAIEVFRPASERGCDSHSWQHHQVLVLRYIQQLTQNAVALRLGITARHLRREQASALQALEEYLRLQYDLDFAASGSSPEIMTRNISSPEINREMAWLADSQRDHTSEVGPVLHEILGLVQALAKRRSVQVEIDCDQDLPLAAVPRTVLRQMVLNLLSAVLGNLSQSGVARLRASLGPDYILISIATTAGVCSWREVQAIESAAQMSRRLAEMFGAELNLSEIEDTLVIQLRLALVEQQTTVLAIEDNADTLQLWKRYVQNTHFCLVEEPDPAHALARAASLRPDLIILDVMLPGIDGWDLLSQLRAQPTTRDIPVIVCTVMPQRDLALSLGASGFIQKPVTGRSFRSELESQIAAANRR
jgi:CheY-like chemotaxis protein